MIWLILTSDSKSARKMGQMVFLNEGFLLRKMHFRERFRKKNSKKKFFVSRIFFVEKKIFRKILKTIFPNGISPFKKTIWPIFRADFESEVKIGHITSEKCEIRLSKFFKIKTSDNKKTSDSDVFFLKSIHAFRVRKCGHIYSHHVEASIR